MKKITMLFALTVSCAIQLMNGQSNKKLTNYLQNQTENSGVYFTANDVLVTSENTSRLSDITHIYFSQSINGIQVIGTESSIHINASDQVLNKSIKLVESLKSRANASSPSISALLALTKVSDHLGYIITEDITVLKSSRNVNQETVFSEGGIASIPIPVKLVYTIDGDIARLAWEISIREKFGSDFWNVHIDASNGQILYQTNWTISCTMDHDHGGHEEKLNFNANLFDIPNYEELTANGGCTECYEVFELPIESPYFGSRTIAENQASDASPFGWHDTNGEPGAEFTITRGNNVYAYEDGDNLGFSPDGTAALDFTGFPFDQNYNNANQYESAALTQLFYLNNKIHDILDPYGFDAASGNFQENNYGLGGQGSDSVNAEAQDGSGTCNANMSPGPDGFNPTMQMYICDNQDGDFDSLVVVHEYVHGVSIRLTGGAANAGCLDGEEQMGEGWSDYIGAIVTMTAEDLAEEPRAVGTYLFGQGPNGFGIRPAPYSTDMNVNPLTYDSIKTVSVPHGVGTVWATMLWDMTWAMIDQYGFNEDLYTVTGDISQDAGNVMALAIVMEGMKLQPCGPGFVDGRDAILAADAAIYGGANECLIWETFAARGLGLSADQGSVFSRGDGTEAFDTPPAEAVFSTPNNLCQSEGTQVLGGGFPAGGIYSGPGVTDNADGVSYTFDPVDAGVGVHSITYSIEDGTCSIASSSTDEVEVLFSPNSPITVGVTDFCVGEEVTVTATLTDSGNAINWYDAPQGGNFLAAGETYTFTPVTSTTVYAQEGPLFTESDIKITELSLQFPDFIEITNIGAANDYTGYKLVLSEEPFDQFNTINPIEYDLGMMQENEVRFFVDDTNSDNYWGNNIWWGEGGSGWALIVSPTGEVIESVFWNASEALISTLNVTVNGFAITGTDIEWSGAGADFDEVCNSSFRRVGENNTSTNWASDCLNSDFGDYNDDLELGFQGCIAARAATQVVAETVAPTINCPDDIFVTINAGDSYLVPDFSTGADVMDGACSADFTTVSQSVSDNTPLTGGVYDVVLTAIDGAGNSSLCTFTITVDEVLAIEENELSNNLSLYPNPTTGALQLVNNTDTIVTEVIITDINGRKIQVVRANAQGTTSFSLASLANGMYFVTVVSDKGLAVKRVLKK